MRSLLLAVLALALAGPAAASELKPTAAELESELVCPVCETTLDTSDAPAARRIKAYIRARIAAGDTKSEIKEQLVGQFGEAVLAAPPTHGFNLLAWLLPLVGLAGAAATLGVLAWSWTRAGREPSDLVGSPNDEAVDPELERRLAEELALLER